MIFVSRINETDESIDQGPLAYIQLTLSKDQRQLSGESVNL